MENKTTTELLELLRNLDENKDYASGGKYELIMNELKRREPFLQILSEDMDDSMPFLKEKIEMLEEEIKKLKRHKHDAKTDDVVIRI